MRVRFKPFFITIVGLGALVAVEQTEALQCSFSRVTSATHTNVAKVQPRDDLVSTVAIERPIFRWLPLIKFGESVFTEIRQEKVGAALLEQTAITRTRLLVIGLCSTARYDRLASAPFERVHRGS